MKNPTVYSQDFRSRRPATVAVGAMKLPELDTYTLSCGARLCVYNRPEMQVAYLTALQRGGLAEAECMEVAAFAAGMVREGSEMYEDDTTTVLLDLDGASLRLEPGSHHMRYSVYCTDSVLSNVLPVFAAMVCLPTFEPPSYVALREAMARRIEISERDVNYLANCVSDSQIMGQNHPLARMASPEVIRSITPDDLFIFHRGHLVASGLTLMLVGNATPDVIQQIDDEFCNMFIDADGTDALVVKPFEPAKPLDRMAVELPGALQSAVSITLPAIPRSHPHYIPLHLAVRAFGGYFGSRLMLNIREEKGLTYGIHASLSGYLDDACIEITAQTDAANVEALINEVAAEMRGMSTIPCGPEEMQRLCQSAASAQAAVLDTPLSIMDHYIAAEMSGIPRGYFDARTQAIATLTPEIVTEMARLYLNPDLMRITVAG